MLSSLASPQTDPRLVELATVFRDTVTGPGFPCTFTGVPFATGEVSFAHHAWNPADEDSVLLPAVVADLECLADATRNAPDLLAVLFIDHGGGPAPTLNDEFELARAVVDRVREVHGSEGPPPSHSLWTLDCRGVGLFLNFSSANHRARRSRNVGPVLTVIAQARESFDRKGRAEERVRARIRKRIASYDDVPPHPCLGSYGDPNNREALQYFLGDDPTTAWDVTTSPHPGDADPEKEGALRG